MTEKVFDQHPSDVTPTDVDAATLSRSFPAGWVITGILALMLTGFLAYRRLDALVPFGLSVGIVALLGLGVVPLLRQLKAGQVIRQEGPQTHLTKAGTPTMGGIYFIPVGLGIALVWTAADPNIVAAVGLTLAYGCVGWLDDWQVIRQQSNQGLTPRQKFLLQVLIAIGFCGWLAWSGLATQVTVPGLGVIPLGWAFWPLVLFVLVGTNNAVNLTDGMDGLAAGVVALILLGLGAMVASHDPNLAMFGVAMSGSCLGFLAFNRHPAQVFMGDTGSLGLGGALAALAIMGDCLWALALMGAVLIVEALSVIIQVSYFKYTKRRTGAGQRLFRMSPIHHHLELGGWSEIRVVSTFYGLTGLLAMLGWWISVQ